MRLIHSARQLAIAVGTAAVVVGTLAAPAAQAAGTPPMAATAHTDPSRTNNDRWLPWLSAETAKLGLKALPSGGNFRTVRFGSQERAGGAKDWMRNAGVRRRLSAERAV